MAKLSDLKRAIVNGTGIVVSILLAFAIDAAWDARSQRLEEEALLQGLREEFTANLRQLDVMVDEYHRQDSLLVRFFSLPTPPTEVEAQMEVEGFYLALMWFENFDANMGALEMMLNGGKLDLVSSPELQTLIWTWKRQYEDTEDDIGSFWPHIQEGRRVLGQLGARGIRMDLRPAWSEQFQRIRSSQELSALAHSVLIDREEYWSELETLRETTEELLRSLE